MEHRAKFMWIVIILVLIVSIAVMGCLSKTETCDTSVFNVTKTIQPINESYVNVTFVVSNNGNRPLQNIDITYSYSQNTNGPPFDTNEGFTIQFPLLNPGESMNRSRDQPNSPKTLRKLNNQLNGYHFEKCSVSYNDEGLFLIVD